MPFDILGVLRHRKTWLPFLSAGVGLAAAVLLPPLGPWDSFWKDRAVRNAPLRPSSVDALVLGIDETSFETIQRRWPWPRTILAEGIRRVTEDGARMVVLDIGLWDPGFTEAEDQALAEALAALPHVLPVKLGVQVLDGQEVERLFRPLPRFRQALTRVGFINLAPDPDGVIRDQPGPLVFNDREYPSLAMAALDGPSPLSPGSVRTFRWLGSPGSVPRMSFAQAVTGDFEPGTFAGKTVFIGALFPESKDVFATPFRDLGDMYGVEYHAQAYLALRHGAFLDPPPRWASAGVLLGFLMALTLLFFGVPYALFLPAVGLAAAGAVGFLEWTTHQGVLWPATSILVIWFLLFQAALWGRYLGEMRERRRITGQFKRYVSPKVVSAILQSGEEVNLGGEEREVTILFTDIRGFTTLSENWEPSRVVKMLNEHFTELCRAVFEHDGTVSKFIGDALMAVFNAPLEQFDAPLRAVRTALSMRRRLAAMNDVRIKTGEKPIQIGVGIHCGRVISGNIGSYEQMDYTVIGDAVNVASRVESLCKEFKTDILITDDVYNYVKDHIAVGEPHEVTVKGRKKPIRVYEVLGEVTDRNT